MKRVLIGGIGNVLAGDDGVGPYTVRLLNSLYEFSEGVEVADLGTPGLDLVAHLSAADALVLVDSVANDKPAGTVTLYWKEDVLRHGPALVRVDPHSPALTESLFIADMAGGAPRDLLLVGVTGADPDHGPGLSDPVRCATNHAIAAILAELDRLQVGYRKRAQPEAPDIWWERGA